MANATEERLKALEAEIKELREQNAGLLEASNPKPKRPAAPIEDDGPRTTFPRSAPIQMPTMSEYEKLFSIVARTHPKVAPHFERDSDRREFFTGFVASFERIANLRRSIGDDGGQVLNMRHDAGHWANEAYSWLQQRGTPAETLNGSFFAACIAAGDVKFSLPNRGAGIVSAYVSLSYDGVTASTAGWQSVLERGQPRRAEDAPQPARQESGSAQVRYG